MKKCRKIFTIFVVLSNASCLATLRPAPAKLHSVDNLFAQNVDRILSEEKFVGTVLIAHKGFKIYDKGFGYSNIDKKIKNDSDTLFRIGSLTKQFTAAAILRLAEKGRLNLSDHIDTHFKNYPKNGTAFAGKKVRILDLLNHTSGIKDYLYFNFAEEFVFSFPIDKELMSFFILESPVMYEPGRHADYSNSNYFLLGRIIEKASNTDYIDFLKNEWLNPLNIKDISFSQPSQNRVAIGYKKEGEKFVDIGKKLRLNDPDYSWAFSAGGILASANSLLQWDNALSSGKLINKSSQQKMFSEGKDYFGFGWKVHPAREASRIYAHSGAVPYYCFTSEMLKYPANNLTIIMLSNLCPSDLGTNISWKILSSVETILE